MAKCGVGKSTPYAHSRKVQSPKGRFGGQRYSFTALKRGQPTGPLFHPPPPAPVRKAAWADPRDPATRGSCPGKVRREDGLWLPRPGNARGGGRGRSDRRAAAWGGGLPPASHPLSWPRWESQPHRGPARPHRTARQEAQFSPTSGPCCQGLGQASEGPCPPRLSRCGCGCAWGPARQSPSRSGDPLPSQVKGRS